MTPKNNKDINNINFKPNNELYLLSRYNDLNNFNESFQKNQEFSNIRKDMQSLSKKDSKLNIDYKINTISFKKGISYNNLKYLKSNNDI